MNTKKILALLLALMICACAFVSCDGQEADVSKGSEDQSGTSSNDGNWVDENGFYTTGLTKEDLGSDKKTFTILCTGNQDPTYQSVDFTYGDENTATFYGEEMNTAVKERYNKVEQEYGVKIVGLKSDQVLTDARGEAMSASGLFDAMVIPFSSLATLVSESNSLVDLKTLDSSVMMLDAPWWDKGANDAFTIGDKLYFTTGDISILNKITTMGVLFNKDLVADYGLESPYDLVRSKQWTLDKMMEMSKVVPEDEGSKIHGLLTGYNDADDLYISFGGTYTEKDANGIPRLTIADSKNINIGVKLLETFSQRGKFILFAQECEAPIWETSFAEFYEGRVLFRVSGFSAANKMRDYKVTFGIVPVPLFDNTQENYTAAAGTIAGVGILKNHENPEWVAKMLNITAAGGKTYCTKAYYEVCLKTRDSRDDDSEEMLDIIFNNLYYDIGLVFDFGKLSKEITDLCTAKSTAYASTIDKIKDTAQDDLDELISKLDR